MQRWIILGAFLLGLGLGALGVWYLSSPAPVVQHSTGGQFTLEGTIERR